MKEHLQQELTGIKEAGLYKNERIITTPQRANIKLNDGRDVLNFCANNYLGLSDNQRLIDAAVKAMETHGYGMSSVRFICGTQDLHKELEAAIGNMSASITGMICSGGNHCCCLKVISAVDSAFTAAELAICGAAVKAPHGILDISPEQTMQNLGLIADPGMRETEAVIVDIMRCKGTGAST